MNKLTTFSSIPVGEKFEYKGQIYYRYTHSRGKSYIDGKMILTNFYKHKMVTWINAYPSTLDV